MAIATLPLVCTDTLNELADYLCGEPNPCHVFVNRYIEMWPGRFERIHAAVIARHDADAMDAALSLRSSSMMVGAARLGAMTTDIIDLVERGCLNAAAKKLTALRLCGNQTTNHLTTSYINAA